MSYLYTVLVRAPRKKETNRKSGFIFLLRLHENAGNKRARQKTSALQAEHVNSAPRVNYYYDFIRRKGFQPRDRGRYRLWHRGENEIVNDIEFLCIPGKAFIFFPSFFLNPDSVTRLPPDTGLILDFILYNACLFFLPFYVSVRPRLMHSCMLINTS